MEEIDHRVHVHFRPHYRELPYSNGDFETIRAKGDVWAENCYALILKARETARATKELRKPTPWKLLPAQSVDGKNQDLPFGIVQRPAAIRRQITSFSDSFLPRIRT
jgi:hypothetical protein